MGAQPQMTAPAPLQSMGEEEGDVTEGFVPAEPTPPKEVRAPQPMVLPPMLPLWATGFLAFILVALAVWLRKMRSGS
ncbi:MAG: hypothetical protein D6803_02550 [Anaerolineae bacterium]|nr:MAG: hypothetical protein D6803_02550 [Anaerolineae bacterium]